MSSRARWFICFLLFAAALLNYLDRQTLSVSASHIADEMHLGDAELGWLFFGFLFSYGIAQLFIGPLLDRFHVVTAYAVAVVAWSLVGAGTALATGFAGLFAVRLLLGVCESPNWPLALRVTARVFPPHQRSLAIGIFQSGASIGALIAPPVIIWLTHSWNWRTAFVVCGALGLVWVILWRVGSRQLMTERTDLPAGLDRGEPGPAADQSPSTMGGILRSRAFWGLAVATIFMNPLNYLYATWLPRYFENYAGVEFGQALATKLILVYLALDLGLWTGGGTATLLSRRLGVTRARLLIAGVGVVAMALIPLVSGLESLTAITAIICTATFGLGCFIVTYLSFVSEVSTTRVATAAGWLGGIGSIAGAGFMLLVGNTVAGTSSFNLTFVMAGVMPLLAFGGMVYGATGGKAAGIVAGGGARP